MAQISPNVGVPTVSPDATPGNDYQNVRASPEQTGGLIAQGVEKLGAGASKAGDFFGEVQTDDASNNYQKAASEITENFKTLNGADALNAQVGVKKQLDDLYAAARGGLSRPDQQLKFDSQNRPYTDRYILGQISTHAVQQGQSFALKTTADGADVAHNMAATAALTGDEKTLAVAQVKATAAAVKTLQINGQAGDPDAMARAKSVGSTVYATYAEAMAAGSPQGALRAQQFLERPEIQKALGDNYAKVYNQVKGQAAEAQSHVDNAAADHAVVSGAAPTRSAEQTASNLTNPTFVKYNQFLNNGDVQSALRLSEGLRTNAYWDVNHWRTGYGSDTVTRADGSIEPVTATTTITPADAERDLQRRTALASQSAQTQIGPSWNAMTPAAKSALTSVVYNYGHVPNDIANAATSGDPNALAAAIASHAHDNNGVNSQRRIAEASAVLGKFGLGGAQGTTTLQPTMTLPNGAAPAVSSGVQSEAAAPANPVPDVQPAVATTDAAMTPPAAPGVQTAQDLNARKIQWIQQQDWTDERKARATQAAELQYRTAAIAAEATAKDKTEKNNAAANDYVSEMMKGPSTDIVGRIANDQRITSFETRKALWDLALKSSGENNPTVYGKGFNDVYQKILLPPGDPNRISDPTDVLKRGADGGDLTFSGTQKLLTIMNESRKSVDGAGLQTTKLAAYNNAKRYLSFEEDTGFGTKIRDPEGEKLFDTKFTPMFESAFDNWTVKQGKDPYEFPLFDSKKMDEFLQKIRPKAQRDADRLGALGESPTAAEAPNAPLPPAPQGVDQAKWTPIVSQPPAGKNGVIAHNAWANIVSGMVDDPAKNVPLWNASAFVRNGAPRGEAVLSKLGIPYESKGRPEDVGAEPPPGLQAGPLPREKSQYEIEDEAAKERRGTWWAARKAELSNLFASPDWKNMSPEEFHRLVGIPKPKIDEGR